MEDEVKIVDKYLKIGWTIYEIASNVEKCNPSIGIEWGR